MRKLFWLAVLALLVSVASVFVNFGQMFWTYHPSIKVDRYRAVEGVGASSSVAAERRAGSPLSVMSIKDEYFTKENPRSVFDIRSNTRWDAGAFVFNFAFWFLFIAGGFFILKKSRAWQTAAQIATVTGLLFLMVAAFSVRIAPDFLIVAAPFQIWNYGNFSAINLILSFLVFLPISALLLATWSVFREVKPWNPRSKSFAALGGAAFISLLIYLVVASAATSSGVSSWDTWLLANIAPDKPHTLWSDILLPFYDLSHYLLFFVPAVATVALWQSGNRRLALIPLPAINISYFAMPYIKTLYNHPRPEDMFVRLGESAFPGGFATLTVVFLALGVIAFALTKKWRYPLFGFGLGILLCYAWVGMHVHWVGDFVGGYFLGIVVFSLWALILLPLKFIEGNASKQLSTTDTKKD